MGAVTAATELVPIPSTGRRYAATTRVRLGDVDRPRPVAARWAAARHLQDVANEDAVDSGLTNAVAWVVRRTLVATGQVPVLGENLALTTFCSGTGRSWAERRTSIRGDRDGFVEAVSLWVQVDLETDRISALGEEFQMIYGGAAGGRRVSARLSLPGLAADAESRPWTILAVDLDVLGHVNNAAQWAILEEALVNAESDRSGVAEISTSRRSTPRTRRQRSISPDPTSSRHGCSRNALRTIARWRPAADPLSRVDLAAGHIVDADGGRPS